MWSGDPSGVGQSDWLGQAVVTSNESLAIVVDQVSLYLEGVDETDRCMMKTYTGVPVTGESVGSKLHAPFLFHKDSGYILYIHVSNLNESGNTQVQGKILDKDGSVHEIYRDVVWSNSQYPFYIPALVDLGTDIPVSAEIESEGPNITAIIEMQKFKEYNGATWSTLGAGDSRGAYYNIPKTEGVAKVVLPYVTKSYWFPLNDYLGSGFPISSSIAIKNCNPNPGYAKVLISAYNYTGELNQASRDAIDGDPFSMFYPNDFQSVVEIPSGQVVYMDTVNYGEFGYMLFGMWNVVVEVNETTQAGEPCIGAVAYGYGSGSGDRSSAYSGIPLATGTVS